MVTVLQHALVETWLAELRDVGTTPARFRELLRHLSVALFLEASRDLPLAAYPVRTPLTETEGRRVITAPALVPVLRAGIGMAEAILPLVPEGSVRHVGVFRQHDTLEPVSYYRPTVTGVAERPAYILDPMLATGGSASAVLSEVRGWGVQSLRLLCVLGAPEGVARIRADHPDVPIYLCGLDECLNEIGYIVPGLGDAGDRQFNSF
jgi:uracil phosphoribosyltransferase